MIQEVNPPYDTKYRTVAGNNSLNITVQPCSVTPNTVEAFLSLESGRTIYNNNGVAEGELALLMKNTLKNIDFEIDSDGNLIVHATDADNYSLDHDGNLIYTFR